MLLRLDQPVQEPPAIGSQICLSSDCHCSSHIWSNLWNIFMQWQSEAWQLWLLRADGSCTDWSNLRHTGRIYDFRRYGLGYQKVRELYYSGIGIKFTISSNKLLLPTLFSCLNLLLLCVKGPTCNLMHSYIMWMRGSIPFIWKIKNKSTGDAWWKSVQTW